MLGRKSAPAIKATKLYSVFVDRHKVDSQKSTFLPVLPRNSIIKDAIFYKPFVKDDTVDVSIYIDNSKTLQKYNSLTTNELQLINLEIKTGGIIPFVINNIKANKLVVYYEVNS